MKTCPNCKLKVGGGTVCPLCQGELIGEEDTLLWPRVEPPARKVSLAFRVLVFVLLAVVIVCVAVDLLTGPDLHWSAIVALCVAVFLVLLRLAARKRPNVPRLLFQLLVGVSFTVIACDWYTGQIDFSVDLVLPVLCVLTLLANFALSFVKKRYAENGLVYLLMNMLIGVVPYLLLFTKGTRHPMPWVVCLLVSIITFLGLVIFRGRELLAEMQKRLHL